MKKHKLFTMSDNTDMSRGWTYAFNIHTKSEVKSLRCKNCGAVDESPTKEFDVDVEKGTKFPDILQCGPSPSLLVVSEKVVNDWKRDKISGFDYFKVNIRDVRGRLTKRKISYAKKIPRS